MTNVKDLLREKITEIVGDGHESEELLNLLHEAGMCGYFKAIQSKLIEIIYDTETEKADSAKKVKQAKASVPSGTVAGKAKGN